MLTLGKEIEIRLSFSSTLSPFYFSFFGASSVSCSFYRAYPRSVPVMPCRQHDIAAVRPFYYYA